MTKIERKKVIDWKIISCMFWEDRYIKKKQLKGNRTASPQRKIVAQCSLHVMSFKKKKTHKGLRHILSQLFCKTTCKVIPH